MSKHLPPKEKKPIIDSDMRRLPRIMTGKRIKARVHSDFGFTKRNIIETTLAIVLYTAACFTHFEGWIKLAVFAVPFVAAAYTVVIRAIEEISAGEYLDDSVMIIAASIAAFAITQFNAGAAVMVLYRVCKLLEAAAYTTSDKIYDKINMRLPDGLNVETKDGLENIFPQDAERGMVFVVEPGEMIALDGVIIEGMSAVDISMLTGGDETVTVSRGDKICAGSINVSAPLRIRVTKLFEDCTVSRMCSALNNAQKYKSKHERIVERFERIYTPVLAAAGLLAAVIPPIFNGEWRSWIGRGIILLLLSNTAAISATTALSYLGAVAAAAKNGVVIKGTRFVEALYRAKTMVFNKTGTITEGKYSIIDIVPSCMAEEDLLCLAALAEQESEHRIAKAIKDACAGFNVDAQDGCKMETIPGRGVSTIVRGRHIYVGNAALLEEHSIHCAVPRRAGTAIHIALNDKYCGYIILSDKVRDGAFDALEELRVLGVRETVMLTADVRSVARPVAASLNFEMVKPELTPEGKISATEYLLATKPERTSLAYVCDMVGDAEALERADVGVSLAALNCENAVEAADVLIMADDLKLLPAAVRVCKLASEAAIENSLLFVAERLLLVILALCGVLPIIAAAVVDLVCTALMFINTYRNILKKY